jgi:hypothetical protein
LGLRLWVSTLNPNDFVITTRKDYDLTKPASFLEITLVNSGSTPANNVRPYYTLGIFDTLPNELEQFTQAQSAGLQQSPYVKSKDQKMFPGSISPPISDADFIALRSGKKVLAIFGYVLYEDIFRDAHKTEFCAMYMPRLDALKPPRTGERSRNIRQQRKQK